MATNLPSTRSTLLLGGLVVGGIACTLLTTGARGQIPGARNQAVYDPYPVPRELQALDLLHQTQGEADRKSVGCVQCHQNTGDPHDKATLRLGCCDCHRGNPTAAVKSFAHVTPRYPEAWPTSANPVRSYALLNEE